jgi:hypothetical protein
MTDWGFGLALLTVGMGGTLFALWLLSVLVLVLKRLFPYAEETKADSREGG